MGVCYRLPNQDEKAVEIEKRRLRRILIVIYTFLTRGNGEAAFPW